MRSVVNYARTVRVGDIVFVRDDKTLRRIDRIVNSAGRPAKHGKNIVLHTPVGPIRVNTEDPIRIIRMENA